MTSHRLHQLALLSALIMVTMSAAHAQRSNRTPSWIMPEISGPNLQFKTFESEAAGEKVSYLIYLPPGYEMDRTERYPVVYWLHGIGGSQQGVPNICANFTSAIEEKKMPPVIAVFANGMIDSFYCDALNAPYPVESMIIRDLIPHIDSSYRTKSTREFRMIEGFSMGGFGAGHLGFKYPELFGSVSIIDGALVELEIMQRRHSAHFERIFASEPSKFEAEHPLPLLKKNTGEIKGQTFIRQAVGKLVTYNAKLHEALNELEIEHDYLVFPSAGHSVGKIYELLGDANYEFYKEAFSPARSIGS